jgi:hypothetical protein
LVYNYDTDRASNFTYDSEFDTYEEGDIETEEVTDYSTKTFNTLSKSTETQAM